MISTQFCHRKRERDELQAEMFFVHFLYHGPAFEAFDAFSDFLESISCEPSFRSGLSY